MGKYKIKKKQSVGLEIVAKEQNDEVVNLPESRKSDDKPLKKVISLGKPALFLFSPLILGKMDQPATSPGSLWAWNQLPRSPFDERYQKRHASPSSRVQARTLENLVRDQRARRDEALQQGDVF